MSKALNSPKKIILAGSGFKFYLNPPKKPQSQLTPQQKKVKDAMWIELKRVQAYDDYKFWLQYVKRDITNLNKAIEKDRSALQSKKKLRSNGNIIERNTDLLFSDAEHLYKALNSNNFTEELQNELKPLAKSELRISIKNLRDLRVHWEDNRRYFEGDKTIKPRKAAIWFEKNRRPLPTPKQISPWSVMYLPMQEPYIAGIFQINTLSNEIAKIELVFKKHTKLRKRVLIKGLIKY